MYRTTISTIIMFAPPTLVTCATYSLVNNEVLVNEDSVPKHLYQNFCILSSLKQLKVVEVELIQRKKILEEKVADIVWHEILFDNIQDLLSIQTLPCGELEEVSDLQTFYQTLLFKKEIEISECKYCLEQNKIKQTEILKKLPKWEGNMEIVVEKRKRKKL